MKKLFRNIKRTSLCLALALVLFGQSESFAKSPIAVVASVGGNAFVLLGNKTVRLKAGTHIYDFSEIITEMGSQVTLSDYYDHKFHLSGQGHIKFFNKIVELKRGYLWVQSLTQQGDFMVQTANAVASYSKGEMVVSFDNYSGKTQILSIKGDVQFQNVFENNYSSLVEEGKFSFIQKDYENGNPRRPTPIGYSSFKKITGLFKGVSPLEKNAGSKLRTHPTKSRGRNIASKSAPSSGGNFIEMSIKDSKAAVQAPAPVVESNVPVRKLADEKALAKNSASLMNYYSSKVSKMAAPPKKKKWKPNYTKKSNVAIHVFGQGHVKKWKEPKRFPTSEPRKVNKPIAPKKGITPKGRGPASVGGMLPAVNQPSPFGSHMVKEYKKQMRHSNEVNHLIDELQSIEMDYQKSH